MTPLTALFAFATLPFFASITPAYAQGMPDPAVSTPSSVPVEPAQNLGRLLDIEISRLGKDSKVVFSAKDLYAPNPESDGFSFNKAEAYVSSYSSTPSGETLLVPNIINLTVSGKVTSVLSRPLLDFVVETVLVPAAPFESSGTAVQTARSQVTMLLEEGVQHKVFDVDGVNYKVIVNYRSAPPN